MHKIAIKDFFIGEGEPLVVISGPCVIESESHALKSAAYLKKLFEGRNVNFIFKSSYDKANRSSIHSFRGPGPEEGLKILERIKNEFDLPIFTDVHSPEEAREAAEVCDVIQIPAFLCRQTDLIIAAGKTGTVVNIKKGQFMAPWDMQNVIEKLLHTGNEQIVLTERGTTFGYNNLVCDMRSIPIMQNLGYPVLFDASHAVQLPGGLGSSTGGQREFIPTLARAALGAGCNGIYAESHPNPKEAKSDAASVIDFQDLPALLNEWELLYQTIQQCLKPKSSSLA